MTDRDTYDQGLQIRRAVVGEAYVDKALAAADDFSGPLKTRSMLNLAMLPILNRPNELRTHIKGALTNGVTRAEIREVFLQVAIYAGVPAAVDSFRIAGEVFADLDASAEN
jgi:4-carboxymuconolactone decarboxylase